MTTRVEVGIDVHVAVTPVGVPPRVAPPCSQSDADSKGEPGASPEPRHRVVVGPVGWGPPRAVHDPRVVRRDVDDLGIGRLNDDDLGRVIDRLDRDDLLLGRPEVALRARLGAEPLDRGHDLFLLSEERVTELRRPIQLLAHHREHVGEVRERLDARVPGLLLELASLCFTGRTPASSHPPIGLDDLQGVRRRHQDLRQKRIRIERDRREQLIELFLTERRLLGFGGGVFQARRLRQHRARGQHDADAHEQSTDTR